MQRLVKGEIECVKKKKKQKRKGNYFILWISNDLTPNLGMESQLCDTDDKIKQ